MNKTSRLLEWLYLALVAVLPIVWPFNVKLYKSVVPVADFLFVGAAFVWLVALIKGDARIRRSWFYLPLALYLIALSCATLFSVNPPSSAVKLAGKVYLIGLAVLTFNLITSVTSVRRVAGAWLVGTVVTVGLSLLGLALFYLGVKDSSVNFVLHHTYGSLPPGNYPRLEGLFDFPAMLCNYLNVSLMFALMMKSAGWLNNRRAGVLVAGTVVVALFTLTPGLGGVVLSAGLWLWLANRRERPAVSRLILAGTVSIALAFFVAASVTLFSYGPDGTHVISADARIKPSHRALAWQTAYDTFKRHPVFGRGVGMDVSSASYTNPSGAREKLTDAHNTFLSVAGESGLFGLLTLGGVILFLVKYLLPLDGDVSQEVIIRTCLGLAFVGAFLCQSLVGAFEDTRHLWVLFGMIAANREIK